MNKVISIKVLALVVAASILPGTANATSLLEIYQQALQSDPLIHEAEARRLASLEAKPQARALYLPQISFEGDFTKSNSSGNSVGQDASGNFGAFTTE
ncbi:MAG: TolC family protein, partial [Proteobacteria bacterium]|nr:TolC family protein [Pseudomonadota bacterium]